MFETEVVRFRQRAVTRRSKLFIRWTYLRDLQITYVFLFLMEQCIFFNTCGSQENLNDHRRSLKVTDFIYVIMDEKLC